MSGVLLDPARIRELFDLRGAVASWNGGHLTDDPHDRWHALREAAPVHEGTLHGLSGVEEDLFWHGLGEERPSFTAFTYAACDEAYRNAETFASSPESADGATYLGIQASLLMMGGVQHRRYRSLVQPSFVPAKAKWWIEKWIHEVVHALIDSFVGRGEAELNVDFCAAIPVLTITGSFGIDPAHALDVRDSLRDPDGLGALMAPIIEQRRRKPEDDLISVLTEAELTDEDGTHRLTDEEIQSFAHLLLIAGSGTTWKQMGLTLAALLERPEMLAAVRNDRSLLRSAIEESLRWEPTDPMFSRWVAHDVDFHGVMIPRGSVLHLGLGSANRDPARWAQPDEYDIHRPVRPTLGFGGGAHICLGMHVARAEMAVAIGALLDRLPGLRLDPDEPPPQRVGFYERGVMSIPVRFG